MKKYLLKTVVAIGILSFAITGISAVTVGFSESVPTAQATKHLPERAKIETTNYGKVYLSKLEPDAVTFSVKGPGASSYGPGTTVRATGKWYTVNYFATYGKETKMMARFRNSNWSVNSNMITGTFDYK